MKRFSYSIVGVLTFVGIASCGGKNNPITAITNGIAEQCGLGCPGAMVDGVKVKTVAEGNAAISGVPSVDAFFAAAINFESSADNVSSGIDAQIDAIRADFGIKPGDDLKAALQAKIKANIEGSIDFNYQPAQCAVDASATVQAQARCQGKVTPGMASVDCQGSCEVDASASAMCDASADLECQFTGPTVNCMGSCQGTCQVKLDAAAKCSGTCTGMCSGNCSAYSDKAGTMCAGSCDGMCMGSCEAQVDASAKCMGTCNGSCTVTNPSGGCMGAAHADCKAHANASVKCQGKCTGDFTPPKVSAECDASAKAEAKINVQCTPPKFDVHYKLAAGVDAMAQAQFEAALKTLISVRLPALLQATERAKSVAQAGEGLASDAGSAVKDAVSALAKGNLSLKATFGLDCAAGQLPMVQSALSSSSEHLTMSLSSAGDVSSGLGLSS